MRTHTETSQIHDTTIAEFLTSSNKIKENEALLAIIQKYGEEAMRLLQTGPFSVPNDHRGTVVDDALLALLHKGRQKPGTGVKAFTSEKGVFNLKGLFKTIICNKSARLRSQLQRYWLQHRDYENSDLSEFCKSDSDVIAAATSTLQMVIELEIGKAPKQRAVAEAMAICGIDAPINELMRYLENKTNRRWKKSTINDARYQVKKKLRRHFERHDY